MHTYHKTDGDKWRVWFSRPNSQPSSGLKDFATEAEAAAYVSYLNGGAAPAPPPATTRVESTPEYPADHPAPGDLGSVPL